MSDEVNNPHHYNRQGIEVLDVIEAYELPYHLGNVIKYVLRHQYKGHPTQDLQKARFYLDRHLDAQEDLELGESRDELFMRAYDSGYDDGVADGKAEAEECGLPEFREGTRVQWEDESETQGTVIREGVGHWQTKVEWDLCDSEGEHIRTNPHSKFLRVVTPPERIAGSTDAAQAIKNDYYVHNPDEVCGQCAYCYKQLTACEVYVSADRFDDLKFCGPVCLARLVDWQKGVDE